MELLSRTGFSENRNNLSTFLSEGFASVSKYQNIFHCLDNALIFFLLLSVFCFLGSSKVHCKVKSADCPTKSVAHLKTLEFKKERKKEKKTLE